MEDVQTCLRPERGVWKPDIDYPGEYIQQAEIIDHTWQITLRSDMSNDFGEVKSFFVTQEREVNYISYASSELERGGGNTGSDTRGRWVPVANARRLSDNFDS